MDMEDLEVYKKLCRLHIELCDLTHQWPQEEKYESLQRMHSHAEWIGENIGAESSRARTPLAVSREISSVWRK